MSRCAAIATASADFPAPVGPQMMRSLLPAKATLEFVPAELHDRRAAVHVVRRKRRWRQATRRARASPEGASSSPALIAALQAMVAASRSCRARPDAERSPVSAASVSRRQRSASNRGCGIGTAFTMSVCPPKPSISKPSFSNSLAILLEGFALGRAEMQRERKEQPLRRLVARSGARA